MPLFENPKGKAKTPYDVTNETQTVEYWADLGLYGFFTNHVPHDGYPITISPEIPYTLNTADRYLADFWTCNSTDLGKTVTLGYKGQMSLINLRLIRDLLKKVNEIDARPSGGGGGTAFAITSTTPTADGSLLNTEPILVTFNQFPKAEKVNATYFKIKDSGGVEQPSTITVENEYTVKLVPTTPLANGSYTVWVSKDMTNTVGDKLGVADYTLAFTSTDGTVPNDAPTASNVALPASIVVGDVLDATDVTYTYTDTESDPEGATVEKIYSGTLADGSDKAELTLPYTVVEGDVGKYFFAGATPVATSGTLTGTEVFSSGVVAEAIPTLPLDETFTGVDYSSWEGTRWRTAYKDALATAGSTFQIIGNRGQLALASITAGQLAVMNKTTQNKVIDFTSQEQILEFDIDDYYSGATDALGHMIYICPTIPAGSVFNEANYIRFLVTKSAAIPNTNRGILLSIKRDGAGASTMFAQDRPSSGGTLTKYRLIFTNQNTLKLDRWNGSAWTNIYSTTTADIRFTQAYVSVQVQNSETASYIQYVDNLKVT